MVHAATSRRSTDFEAHATDFEVRAADFEAHAADSEVHATDFELHGADFELAQRSLRGRALQPSRSPRSAAIKVIVRYGH